jgi:putative transposase
VVTAPVSAFKYSPPVRPPSVELRRTWRFRLYPTGAQSARFDSHLRLCCELYNAAVQERREAWRSARVSIGFRLQSAQLPAIKAERPDVAGVYSQVLQEVLQRVERAFGGFFARVRRGDRPGFPRFRSAHRFDSLTYPQLGFRVHGRHLHVSKIGPVKIKLHRPIEGRIKTLTIKREAGKWFACFSCEVEPQPLPPSTESIGLDVGLTHFATLSDGPPIPNPRPARRAERQLRRAERRIARRRKGSARRREAVRLFQVAQAHVRHQRADTQHKLSRRLVDRYGLIAVEALNIKGLAGGMLAKPVHDAAWASFIDKLAYKAESAGRILVKVDPRGTSQYCVCGAHVPKTLSQRWHQCPACGLSAARDHVAAQVILRRGLRLQDGTWARTPCVS